MVDDFGSLLWKSNKKKFSSGRIKGEVVRGHPGRYERYTKF